MPDAPLYYQSIFEVSGQIRNRQISPVELTQAYLDRIDELDGTLGAFITLMGERALDQAREAENTIQAGNYRGAMHGVPVVDVHISGGTGTRAAAQGGTDGNDQGESDRPAWG